MADAADDVSNEISLDDFNADEQAPAKADPSPAPKADEPEEKLEAEAADEGKTDDTAPEADAPETETDGEPTDETETDKPSETKPLAPKSENRFQKLSNENRDLRRQVEQLTAQAYEPATVEALSDEVNPETGENYTRLEAKFEADRQERALEKYSAEIKDNWQWLGNESYQVIQDFPIFNSDSEQFDEELAQEAAQLLEANLVRDDNIPEIDQETGKPTGKGTVIGSRVSPYQLYKTLARASGISAAKGEIKGQRNTEQQLANVDAPPSTAPTKKTSDPLMELWKSDD